MKVGFHPAAAEEFQQTAAFYEQRVEGLGERFIREMERTTLLLSERPELGAVYQTHYRRVLMARFPFTVVYRVASDEIQIIAVAHQRQQPGYWVGR